MMLTSAEAINGTYSIKNIQWNLIGVNLLFIANKLYTFFKSSINIWIVSIKLAPFRIRDFFTVPLFCFHLWTSFLSPLVSFSLLPLSVASTYVLLFPSTFVNFLFSFHFVVCCSLDWTIDCNAEFVSLKAIPDSNKTDGGRTYEKGTLFQ